VWYHPRNERALSWEYDDLRNTSSSIADAVSIAGIYPLFGGGVNALTQLTVRANILFKLENRNWTRLVQKPNWTETQGQK
jgi:hypothetical protein